MIAVNVHYFILPLLHIKVHVEVNQRHQANLESSMSMEEEQLKQQIEEEARVSQMIEDYLKNHYEELAGQVDHWMTRHEQDLDMKLRDLHELKVISIPV